MLVLLMVQNYSAQKWKLSSTILKITGTKKPLLYISTATVQSSRSGATQPPIKWRPGALSLAAKWLGCEAGQSPPSYAKG